MIYKMIATFPCGNKIIRSNTSWILRMSRYLKISGQRPHLIQAFVTNPNEEDIEEIHKGFQLTVHPIHGRVTVNGICISTFMRSLQDG